LLQSVASADEGLYALVAREWLRGHLPYTTVWETKPPLLFALLAGAFALFGTSPLALRFATDLAIWVTALALYAMGRSLPRDGRAVGLTAALLYAAMTLSDSASSALAETFYAPFVALPLAYVVGRARSPKGVAPLALGVAGVSLGCALLVKESAALEVAFATCVIVYFTGARSLAPLAAGLGGALALSVLPYVQARALASYWDANYGAVARRAFVVVTDATPFADVARAQALAFFPVTLLALGVPWFMRAGGGEPVEGKLMRFALAWAAVDLLTVAAIREYLGNHFIALMAPAAVAGALVAVRFARRQGRPAYLVGIVALGLLAHCAYQYVLAVPVAYARIVRHDPTVGDPTAQLARYLVAHATPRTTLYVADDRAMLYVLTGLTPPTRYAYSPHLTDPYQETIAGVDGRAEVARILSGHPFYVVRDLANRRHEDPRVRDLLDRELARDYRAAYAVGTRVVYVDARKSAAQRSPR
jgi:4-amino-4-deoxy-L-arabinose transferase-like glycosyltransferase